MIVSGYSLHLYCDNHDDLTKHGPWAWNSEFPVLYFDEERAKCYRDARLDGWRINIKKGTALCPKCSGKKPKK